MDESLVFEEAFSNLQIFMSCGKFEDGEVMLEECRNLTETGGS